MEMQHDITIILDHNGGHVRRILELSNHEEDRFTKLRIVPEKMNFADQQYGESILSDRRFGW